MHPSFIFYTFFIENENNISKAEYAWYSLYILQFINHISSSFPVLMNVWYIMSEHDSGLITKRAYN